MSQALILIDLQNDYFPGGSMELVDAGSAVMGAARLLNRFRQLNLPVIHVQHVALEEDATFFRPDTPGVAIHEAVSPSAGESVVVKHFPNAFRETALLESLRAATVDHIFFVGMMTHMCVDTTVRAAADLGFVCTLAHDACATTHLRFGDSDVDARSVQLAYLAALNDGFASVKSVDAILSDLS